jgi:hypothetical protein
LLLLEEGWPLVEHLVGFGLREDGLQLIGW